MLSDTTLEFASWIENDMPRSIRNHYKTYLNLNWPNY